MTSRMIMWCPGAAALMTCLVCNVPVRSLGWTWPKAKFVAWGYVLPLLYAIPVYLLVWWFIPGSFALETYTAPLARDYHVHAHADAFGLLFGVPTTLIFIVIGTMAWALGEELGWRGFLVPRVHEKLGLVGTGVTTGLLWAVWHYPSLLGSTYNAGTYPPYEIGCFTLMVVSMGVVMAWLRLASGNVWPCVLLHAVHNSLVQGVLDSATSTTGKAPYITSEFGIGLALSITVVAVVVVVKHEKHFKRGPSRPLRL
ncbi:MAG TPA: CPBP family intramembrane glutamic endopeptidase [Dyella sp.]|nr:CPBP family intramembrane glutamic endopeptidase [Dyella sp.]